MPFGPNNSAQSPSEWIRADIFYGESYTSAALNRKLAGVLPAGVIWGFEVTPASGRQVKIWPGPDPDYPLNVVVVERNGYSLTGRAEGEYLLPVPAGFAGYVVIEVLYDHQVTSTAIKLAETPLESHVVLAKLHVPQNAATMLPSYIRYTGREEANPALMVAKLVNQVVTLETHNLETAARLAVLEQWARTQGYTPPQNGG